MSRAKPLHNPVKMFLLLLPTVLAVAAASSIKYEPYETQLLEYKAKTKVPPVRTTSWGSPLDYKTATTSLNDQLISNSALMEMLMHFDREIIPERNAHALGTGAFGYFEVTHDVTKYCKAAFLNKIGKKTNASVRISPTTRSRGGNEFVQENRGFAMKLYTEEGNLDLPGLDSQVFSVNDPLFTADLVHAGKDSPSTNFPDPNMAWDFVSQHNESFRRILYSLSPYGMPASYSHMSGHGVHTYELYNEEGTKYACKIDWWPSEGKKTMSEEDFKKLSSSEPRYYSKTLYNSIKNGKYPSWEMTFTCLNEQQVKKEGSGIYDITKLKAWKKYKPMKVGRLTLNRNYENFFTDVEQMAFCPGRTVPGILGSPDPLYRARTFAYTDTQQYRLGVNFEQLKVNRPYNSKVYTYNRDGAGNVGDNGGAGPWYSVNTFNGPVALKEKNRPSLSTIYLKEASNLDECQDYYKHDLTAKERQVIINNLCKSLSKVYRHIRVKVIDYLYHIDKSLGKKVEECLEGKCAD